MSSGLSQFFIDISISFIVTVIDHVGISVSHAVMIRGYVWVCVADCRQAIVVVVVAVWNEFVCQSIGCVGLVVILNVL